MEEKSRIKFNPTTKEFEIEGSEAFVKAYFAKIQALISEAGESAKEKPEKMPPMKKRGRKRTSVAQDPQKSKRGGKADSVLGLIQKSDQGMTTDELTQQTGLTNKQVWAIVYRAEKMGKIRKAARGVYITQ